MKDLTKTVQFMAVAMPSTPVPRYYHNRQLKSCTVHPKLQEGPQLVLHIPLHKVTSPPPPTADKPSLTVPVSPQTSPPPPTADKPSLTVPVSPQTSPPPPTADKPSPPVPQPLPSAVPPLIIPEATYQQLVAELLADPNMEQILNYFPFNNYDDDMNPFVQDDFAMDDISPIETEMNMY